MTPLFSGSGKGTKTGKGKLEGYFMKLVTIVGSECLVPRVKADFFLMPYSFYTLD